VRPLTSAFFGLSQPVTYSSQNNLVPTQTESTLASTAVSTAGVNDVSQTLDTSATTATANGTEPTASVPNLSTQPEPDAKSDISFDPLFDEDADGELDDVESSTPALSIPGTVPSSQAVPPFQGRSLIPPKNAPPLLDPTTYSTFSPDILMTASIDGQVILWDRRVTSSGGGTGVGRLWMSDKTPPWCLSVCLHDACPT
jgi:transcriptional activator SPT8